jgi:ketosteroid isomerase-like protein
MYRLKLIFILPCLFLFSNIQAQNYIGKKKDINKILKNIEQFSAFYVAGDIESLVDSYTIDGKIFPGRTKIIEGKEKLLEFWTPRNGSKTIRHKVTPTELKIVKKTAYDYGYYEGTSQNAKGENFEFSGKYVIVWKKIKGEWKIYLDIWNRID